MTKTELPRSKNGCLAWGAWSLGIGVVAVLILPFSSRNLWMLELPYHLIAGSALHATRASAHFAVEWPQMFRTAALPSLAMAVVLWGAHHLILWWRSGNEKNEDWHFKHTALAGSLVLLGSAAAIALSGVLHEAAWLPQGTIIQSNTRSTMTSAVSNARQLGLMLFEHENQHGTYPSSLLDLEKSAHNSIIINRMVFVELDSHGPPEPFVLVKSGEATGRDAIGILMIGPQMPGRGDFVVLRTDNSVTRQPAAKLIEVVKSATDAGVGRQ